MLALVFLLALFGLVFTNEVETIKAETGCVDQDNVISCCICENIGFINLDGCADIIVDWENLNITLQLTLNNVVLFETTFGFDTAPMLCADIWGSHICLELVNLNLDNWELTGCLDLIIDNIRVPMGCFDTTKPVETY
eukprot:gnl/Chilomastix_caulleri/81.p1 GENE.gnl/Chilomastix_caulleri/81~~gnl/Chilomastix_caulleri/81.p1  ORF type:complete len:160 (+),score=24.07 gnl/Chilomastix_caulleri/81:68-481(+)